MQAFLTLALITAPTQVIPNAFLTWLPSEHGTLQPPSPGQLLPATIQELLQTPAPSSSINYSSINQSNNDPLVHVAILPLQEAAAAPPGFSAPKSLQIILVEAKSSCQ